MILYNGKIVTQDSFHDGIWGHDIFEAVDKNRALLCGDHYEVVVPRLCLQSWSAWIPTTIRFILVAD